MKNMPPPPPPLPGNTIDLMPPPHEPINIHPLAVFGIVVGFVIVFSLLLKIVDKYTDN